MPNLNIFQKHVHQFRVFSKLKLYHHPYAPNIFHLKPSVVPVNNLEECFCVRL